MSFRIQPNPWGLKVGVPRTPVQRVRIESEDGAVEWCWLLVCGHLVPEFEHVGRGKTLRAKGVSPKRRRCVACLTLEKRRLLNELFPRPKKVSNHGGEAHGEEERDEVGAVDGNEGHQRAL